jgi:hypothetical protein
MKVKIIGSKEAMKIPLNEFVNTGIVIRKGRTELAIIADDPATFEIVKGLEKSSSYFIPTLEETRVFLNSHNIEFEEININKDKNFL